jgi:uncharacterized membrane protein YgaE (UPF0421/DUF939 family)
MKDSLKRPKPTLESLLKENQVVTGKDLMKRKEDKEREMALFQEALEFEERHRKPKPSLPNNLYLSVYPTNQVSLNRTLHQ